MLQSRHESAWHYYGDTMQFFTRTSMNSRVRKQWGTAPSTINIRTPRVNDRRTCKALLDPISSHVVLSDKNLPGRNGELFDRINSHFPFSFKDVLDCVCYSQINTFMFVKPLDMTIWYIRLVNFLRWYLLQQAQPILQEIQSLIPYFRYNLEGAKRLRPNFRTFVVTNSQAPSQTVISGSQDRFSLSSPTQST